MGETLTDLKVKNTKPREKRYTLFDSGGLYLEIAPNGSKWWRFRYSYGGKQKVISFGVYPAVSLKNAREKRDSARTLLANGGNPAAERHEQNARTQAPVFKQVAEEWFSVKMSSWTERHKKSVRQRLDKYLIGKLDHKPFSDLEVSDFLPILREIESRRKFETAHRVAQICNQICRFAKLSGIIKANPIDGVSEILVTSKVTPMAALTKLDDIKGLLVDIQHYTGSTITCFALRIMPYVFVRSGELRGARWNEINFDTATWTIPAERMKRRREHIVPMARQVVKLFQELKYFSGEYELCFPSPMSNSCPITDVCLLNALRRLGYRREQMCIHSFRSIASTLLNEQGYRPDIIETQLSHVEGNAVRAAYNRSEYLEERRKMMQEWADYLDNLRDSA